MPWIRIATTAEIPPCEAREFVVEGRIVAVFNVAGEYFALDGICPHQGGPLGKGLLQGCILTCPWHGWQFDVRTGRHQASPTLKQAGWPIRVDDEQLFVEMS
jgi:nitrite reductase (NADH) small subunit